MAEGTNPPRYADDLAALAAHPDFAALAAEAPDEGPRRSKAVTAGAVLVVGGLLTLASFPFMGPVAVVPGLFTLVCVLMVLQGGRKAAAPLERRAAAVVAVRGLVGAAPGEGGRRRVRCEVEGGGILELVAHERLGAALREGMLGVAFTRGDELVDYLPLEYGE